MKLLIVSHVAHSLFNSKVYGYGPYIKEMNLWLKHVEAVKIVAPIIEQKPNAIDLAYKHNDLHMLSVPSFNITSKLQKLLTLMKMPYIFFVLLKGMLWADHIHLRCPGNMGLLGSIAQIFFPWKVKTAKYAGNWDPKSKQPRSYRIQQWILSNVFLSKRMKVLVYGEWKNQSTNIIPFFTASYKKNEICQVENRTLDEEIRLLFVGGLNEGKRPLISIQVAQKLIEDGYNVCLDMFGEGNLSEELSAYVKEHNLEKNVILHGNKSADIVKAYFQKAHFLIFISKSEGWPKVVAEAMFWGCLPITTNVSCVEYMIGFGERGKIAKPDIDDILNNIKLYKNDKNIYNEAVQNAQDWSRQFTLESFEIEIQKLIK